MFKEFCAKLVSENPRTMNDNDQFRVGTRDATPSNLLIKIQSVSLLSEYGISEYQSREFESGGYKWKVTIRYHEEDFGVYLMVAETTSFPKFWEINVVFTFFLYDHFSDNYHSFQGNLRRFNAINPKCGYPKLISKENLLDPKKGYVVEDSCVFGAEVCVMITQAKRVMECLCLQKPIAPLKREFKLSKFSKLEGIWRSEELTVGSHKWRVYVHVHPKKTEKGKERYVTIFVECVDSKSFAPYQKVKPEICIRIKSQQPNKPHVLCNFSNVWFTSSAPEWGCPEFMKFSEMKAYLVKDCCFLEIEISVQAIVLDAPQI